MLRYLALVAPFLLAGFLLAQTKPTAVTPDPNGPRPIAAVDSAWIEDLTWMEVRDALKAGKTTAIVATGGVEQNGPYLVTGKHNVILKAICEAIARRLGNTLIAPIVGLRARRRHRPADRPHEVSRHHQLDRGNLRDGCSPTSAAA